MTTAQTFDLSGKLVLVTGATRGIGRAVAIGAAAAGAELDWWRVRFCAACLRTRAQNAS